MTTSVLNGQSLAASWNRVRRSAMLYGAFATAVRVGANVMLLPLVLKILPPPELALWWVFLALGAVANLADFGFGQAIARVYSFLWAGAEDFDTEGLGPPPENHEPNRAKIRLFHHAVQRLYLRIALVGVALLIIGGTFFLFRPVHLVHSPAVAWISWAAYVLAIGFTLATSHWMLACQGINQMRELQAAYFFSGLAYLLSAAAFLLIGWGLFAMVGATAIRAIVLQQLCRRAYHAAVPEEGDEAHVEFASLLTRIWPNAWKFGVLSIGVYLIFNGNVLICSHFLGSEVTASFGLTTQVAAFIANFSALWLTVKWPQMTILRTQGRLEEMGVLFARRLACMMVTYAALSALLVFLGNTLLEWKGTQTRFLATSYLIAYLLYLGQQQFYAQFGTLVYTENVVPFFKLSLFTGLALIALTLILVQRFGLWGLIAGPIIVTVAASSWYVTLRGFRGQPLNVRQFTRAALLGHL